MQAGVGHYGVFSGKRWEKQVYPIVRNIDPGERVGGGGGGGGGGGEPISPACEERGWNKKFHT